MSHGVGRDGLVRTGLLLSEPLHRGVVQEDVHLLLVLAVLALVRLGRSTPAVHARVDRAKGVTALVLELLGTKVPFLPKLHEELRDLATVLFVRGGGGSADENGVDPVGGGVYQQNSLPARG